METDGVQMTLDSLTAGRARANREWLTLPTGVSLGPVVVAARDEGDRSADRVAGGEAAAAKRPFCSPNRGWRRLLLLLALALLVWLGWELRPRGEVGDRAGLSFSGPGLSLIHI